MRDPHELFRFETDVHASDLGARTMVVSLGGLIDAGHAQRLMTQHLLSTLEHTVIASFDVDQLLDYRGRRPMMVFDADHFAGYGDPTLLLHRVIDADGTPFLLLAGPEPDYQWERFIEAVRSLVRILGVQLVVSAHGIPMAVPHTRPIGVTRYASDPSLIPGNTPVFGRTQVPSSAEQLLLFRLSEAGVDTAGIAVHVPHYLTQIEFADGAVAAVEGLRALTGLDLPMTALHTLAITQRAEIAEQIEGNEEVGEVVHGLEQQYDAFTEGLKRQNLLANQMAQLPSADEIAAEAEKFLREETDAGNSSDAANPGEDGPDFIR